MTGVEKVPHPVRRRAVQVAVVRRVLEELAALDELLEFLTRHERVVDAVALARPRPACRVRHRTFEMGVGRDELVDDGVLADTGRSGEDDEPR